jgi:microcystin degradation protein MlrC
VRVFIAMVSHETNTFSAIPTDRRQFEARDLRDGGKILEAYRKTGTCLGGVMDGRGAQLSPAPRHRGRGLAGRTRGQGLLRGRQEPPARRAGAGLTLPEGGQIDPRHGGPLIVTGRVRTLSDGRFIHKGPMFRGLEGRLGSTAVLDVDDVKVILISNRRQTLDPEMICFVDIDPLGERLLVVKSTVHCGAAFEPIVPGIIEVDAPGLSSSNLGGLDFTRVRRPIFPLDDL